jgi:hypothetical protein
MDMPPRLFKYEALTTQTLRNLKGQVLYFGSPKNFNDPYDCALEPQIKVPTDDEVEAIRQHHLSEKPLTEEQRQQFNEIAVSELREMFLRSTCAAITDATQKFLDTGGATCFSEKNDDLLMWSHYGGRYKGICLEFNTSLEPFNRALPVRYLQRLPEIDVARILVKHDFKLVEELFCAKSASWSYEREWRALHKDAGTSYNYASEALTGVYFGPDIDDESLEIACLVLAGQNGTVALYHGSRSRSEFKVNFERFTYTSYLEAKKRGLRK